MLSFGMSQSLLFPILSLIHFSNQWRKLLHIKNLTQYNSWFRVDLPAAYSILICPWTMVRYIFPTL